MNWKTYYETERKFSVCTIIFEGESKKESIFAKKMNVFYGKVIDAVKKNTEKDNFPEGGKYYVEIKACENDRFIDVYISARLKAKGKTLISFKEKQTWKNGLIHKQKGHNKTNGRTVQ